MTVITVIYMIRGVIFLVKLLLKDYKLRVSDDDLICNNCLKPITKGTKYYKYSSEKIFHRLHAFCYVNLTVESIEISSKQLKEITQCS